VSYGPRISSQGNTIGVRTLELDPRAADALVKKLRPALKALVETMCSGDVRFVKAAFTVLSDLPGFFLEIPRAYEPWGPQSVLQLAEDFRSELLELAIRKLSS